MIQLDEVEIQFSAEYLTDKDDNRFISRTLYDKDTGAVFSDCEYLNLTLWTYGDKPLGIKRIKIDRTHQTVSIIITSKILLELYPKLITKETIKTALQNLNKLGYISFNPDLVIYLSTVSYFDLTRDVFLSGPTEDYLRDLRILGTTHNYRIKNHKSGYRIVFRGTFQWT